MRYTTIIDISEIPEIYGNHNARLLFLHMTLKSGYHDEDRDLLRCSIRTLAARTGISVSATRNALRQLMKAGLLTQENGTWRVRKFILEQQPTPRAKTRQQAQERSISDERERMNEQREREAAQQREQRKRENAAGTNGWMLYYEKRQREAAAGDHEAAAIVKRYAARYEQMREQMRAQTQTQRK